MKNWLNYLMQKVYHGFQRLLIDESNEVYSQMLPQCKGACEQQDWSTVRSLLMSSSFKIMKHKSKQRVVSHAFVNACAANQMELVKLVLLDERFKNVSPIEQKVERFRFDMVLQNYHTGLNAACANGHLALVKYLLHSTDLSHHAHLEGDDGKNLEVACTNGHWPVVQHLLKVLKMNPDIDMQEQVNNCLFWSAREGHSSIVECLLQEMAAMELPVAQALSLHGAAIVVACEQGNLPMLQILASDKEITAEQASESNDVSYRALWAACAKGHQLIVKYLLTDENIPPILQANIYEHNAEAFKQACSSGQEELIKYLILDYGIQANADVQHIIQSFPHIKKLVETRELHQSLQSTLNKPLQTIAKRRKL